MESPDGTPLLLSPAAAARKLSVGRSAIFDLMRSGELASFKMGRSRRIPVAALEDYIQKRLAS